jgi:hypothetical protein
MTYPAPRLSTVTTGLGGKPRSGAAADRPDLGGLVDVGDRHGLVVGVSFESRRGLPRDGVPRVAARSAALMQNRQILKYKRHAV